MLFTFPSRYLFAIGRSGVLRLGGWSPHVQTGFHVSRPTLTALHFTGTGLSPMSRSFPTASHSFRARPSPRSLATTNGVSIDVLSSGYLDVSVPRVRFKPLFYSRFDTCFQNSNMKPPKRSHLSNSVRWVSPFGNPWIKGCSPLPTAYRSVPRPSSPLSAKASTEYPSRA